MWITLITFYYLSDKNHLFYNFFLSKDERLYLQLFRKKKIDIVQYVDDSKDCLVFDDMNSYHLGKQNYYSNFMNKNLLLPKREGVSPWQIIILSCINIINYLFNKSVLKTSLIGQSKS